MAFYNFDRKIINSIKKPWGLKIATTIEATGGTVSDIDIEGVTYRIHAFTTLGDDSFVVESNVFGVEAEILLVGGGGGGGDRVGGGGGAGELYFGMIVPPQGTYPIYVGVGGAGAVGTSTPSSIGDNGEDSYFKDLIVKGGGGGGGGTNGNGTTGGSGGGATGYNGYTGGSSVINIGVGNSGGSCYSNYGGGGGGGAGLPGEDYNGSSYKTDMGGGDGLYYGDKFSDSFGVNGWFAGGGGGAAYSQSIGGDGGKGGGGKGAARDDTHTGGVDNTGSGGGARERTGSTTRHKGGSGIILIRYPI